MAATLYHVLFPANPATGVLEQFTSDGSTSSISPLSGVKLRHSPSAVVFKQKLFIFYHSALHPGQVWCKVEGSTAEPYKVREGVVLSPSAVVFDDHIYLFLQVDEESIEGSRMVSLEYVSSPDGKHWSEPKGVRVFAFDSLGVVALEKEIYVFWQEGRDNGDQHKMTMGIARPGIFSVLDTDPHLVLGSAPSAIEFQGQPYVFSKELNDGRNIQYVVGTRGGNGYTWNPATIDDTQASSAPSAFVFSEQLVVFFRAGEGEHSRLLYTSSSDGVSWQPAQPLAGIRLSEAPCAVLAPRVE